MHLGPVPFLPSLCVKVRKHLDLDVRASSWVVSLHQQNTQRKPVEPKHGKNCQFLVILLALREKLQISLKRPGGAKSFQDIQHDKSRFLFLDAAFGLQLEASSLHSKLFAYSCVWEPFSLHF